MEAVLERRLRPLYDSIDLKNYKAALKQVATLEQKYADNLHIKMLRALVLERMGRQNDALLACREVKSSVPTDERILNDLATVLSRLGHAHESTESYEAASVSSPSNIELQLALFGAYVREEDYIKQQQVSMRLYKKLGKENYLLWAVCSIQLQARSMDADGAKLLQLATLMLERHIQSRGLGELESFLVYISVLQSLGRDADALEAVKGPLGNLFAIPLDRLRLQADLHMRLHQWDEASHVCKDLLRSSPDDWEGHQWLVESALKAASDDAPQEEPVDAANATSNALANLQLGDGSVSEMGGSDRKRQNTAGMKLVHDFLQELQKLPRKELCRGVELAELELQLQGGKDLQDFILPYCDRYGHMVSCASDTRKYVGSIARAERRNFSMQLHGLLGKPGKGDLSVNELRRYITAFQLDEFLGMPSLETDAEVVQRAIELARLYAQTRNLAAALEQKERAPNEELLLMTANCLVEMCCRSQDSRYLLEAAALLNLGLITRPYSPQFRLMAISLLTEAGATSRALHWFRSLNIKHIQLDTMLHHILPALLAHGLWADALSLITDLQNFHTDHSKNGADLTISAYRHGTYSKVLEFVKFKERLQSSHQLLLCRAQSAVLGVVSHADRPADAVAALRELDWGREPLRWANPAAIQALSFNQDLGGRPWWSPSLDVDLLHAPRGLSGDGSCNAFWECRDDRAQREERWRRKVQMTCLLPRLLAMASGTSSDGAPAAGPVALKEMTDLVARWMELGGISLPHLLQQQHQQDDAIPKHKDMGAASGELLLATFFLTALKVLHGEEELLLLNTSLELPQLLSALQSRVQTALAGDGASSILSVSSIGEFILWHCACFTLCLPFWIGMLQPSTQVKKNRKKKGAKLTAAAADDPGPVLTSPLSDLVKVVASLERVLKDAEAWARLAEVNLSDQLSGLIARVCQSAESISGDNVQAQLVPGSVLATIVGSGPSTKSVENLGHDTQLTIDLVNDIIRSQQMTISTIRKAITATTKRLTSYVIV